MELQEANATKEQLFVGSEEENRGKELTKDALDEDVDVVIKKEFQMDDEEVEKNSRHEQDSTSKATNPSKNSSSPFIKKENKSQTPTEIQNKPNKSNKKRALSLSPKAQIEIKKESVEDDQKKTRTFTYEEQEEQIQQLDRIIQEMLSRGSNRELVKQTATYMKTFPEHALRFQMKIKQRALSDETKQFNIKIMLFYALHEFLRSFQAEDEQTQQKIQREWFQTIDEVLHACVRELKNAEEGRKRLMKTLARWEELGIYAQKIKAWKSMVMGETKPRRPPTRLPRTEAERLAEIPEAIQATCLSRVNDPFLFEREDTLTSSTERRHHWRFTAIAFIEALGKNLVLSQEIVLTACVFFHRIYERGIYAKERYKMAAACVFLSAKAASKRMKLVRMVRTMHDILEKPLMMGAEEILELERLHLLHYEMEVLQGIGFELTPDIPFFYLRRILEQMPEKVASKLSEKAHSVLEELFWLPVCLSIDGQLLAEAAAYVVCVIQNERFSYRWCRETSTGDYLTEKSAKNILKWYRVLEDWKKVQQKHFDALLRQAMDSNLDQVFQSQRGGLIMNMAAVKNIKEFTASSTHLNPSTPSSSSKKKMTSSSKRKLQDVDGEEQKERREYRERRRSRERREYYDDDDYDRRRRRDEYDEDDYYDSRGYESNRSSRRSDYYERDRDHERRSRGYDYDRSSHHAESGRKRRYRSSSRSRTRSRSPRRSSRGHSRERARDRDRDRDRERERERDRDRYYEDRKSRSDSPESKSNRRKQSKSSRSSRDKQKKEKKSR